MLRGALRNTEGPLRPCQLHLRMISEKKDVRVGLATRTVHSQTYKGTWSGTHLCKLHFALHRLDGFAQVWQRGLLLYKLHNVRGAIFSQLKEGSMETKR